jgi:hypothetical protein
LRDFARDEVPVDIEDGFLSHALPLREGEMGGVTTGLRLGADDADGCRMGARNRHDEARQRKFSYYRN